MLRRKPKKAILVIIDIDPDTFNVKSKGKWITAYIEVPEYDVSKISIVTVMLNGKIYAESNPKYGFVKDPEIKDGDGDGYPELMVKFDRGKVIDIVRLDHATLTVSGEIEELLFESSDIIEVIQ